MAGAGEAAALETWPAEAAGTDAVPGVCGRRASGLAGWGATCDDGPWPACDDLSFSDANFSAPATPPVAAAALVAGDTGAGASVGPTAGGGSVVAGAGLGGGGSRVVPTEVAGTDVLAGACAGGAFGLGGPVGGLGGVPALPSSPGRWGGLGASLVADEGSGAFSFCDASFSAAATPATVEAALGAGGGGRGSVLEAPGFAGARGAGAGPAAGGGAGGGAASRVGGGSAAGGAGSIPGRGGGGGAGIARFGIHRGAISIARRASASSAPLKGRCSGLGSSIRATRSSSFGGTSGRRAETRVPRLWFLYTRPVSVSKSTSPSAYTSEAGGRYSRSLACSGLM